VPPTLIEDSTAWVDVAETVLVTVVALTTTVESVVNVS